MLLSLETVNLALDAVLKIVFLLALVLASYMLMKLDKAAKALERAARNVEKSSQTVDDMVSILRRIPLIGPRGESNGK